MNGISRNYGDDATQAGRAAREIGGGPLHEMGTGQENGFRQQR